MTTGEIFFIDYLCQCIMQLESFKYSREEVPDTYSSLRSMSFKFSKNVLVEK